MEVHEHLEFLRDEGELLASAATDVDPDTPVATVPNLSLRELVRHIGGIHRWAATIVREARPERYDTTLLEVVGAWPEDADLVDWFREGHRALVQTLRDADPDLECWHFFDAPTPVAFWARRQTHETAIHRGDAQSCSGAITPYAAELAVDGIDELVFGFGARKHRFASVEPPPQVLLRATDVGAAWRLTLGPEQVGVAVGADIGPDPAGDCIVEASASDLYLLLWNRISADTLDVAGDPECLAIWRDAVRVRWSE